MNVTVNECYELEGDYQNQFLGVEVFPKPKYKKVKSAERTVNKVHYDDVYILQPLHYYYVTFHENINNSNIKIQAPFFLNGVIVFIDDNRMYLFNSSQNIVYLQKNMKIGEVVTNG